MIEPGLPRPLTAIERALIERMTAGVSDCEALRRQLDRASVVRQWSPGGIDIDVPSDVVRFDGPAGVLPVRATVSDASGALVGEVLVWTADGRLAALEYAWWSDDPPSQWPDTANVHISDPGGRAAD